MNVKYDPKSGLVTCTFIYKADGSYNPSKTGKSLIVASTGGNQVVDGTDSKLKVGVNAFVMAPAA